MPPDGSPAIYVRGDEDRLRQLILVLLETRFATPTEVAVSK